MNHKILEGQTCVEIINGILVITANPNGYAEKGTILLYKDGQKKLYEYLHNYLYGAKKEK